MKAARRRLLLVKAKYRIGKALPVVYELFGVVLLAAGVGLLWLPGSLFVFGLYLVLAGVRASSP